MVGAMQGSLANVTGLNSASNLSAMPAQALSAFNMEQLRQTLRHDFTHRRRLSEQVVKHVHGQVGSDGCVRGTVKGDASNHSDFWARCVSPSDRVSNSTLWVFLAKVHPDPRQPPCICIPGVVVQSQGVISEPRRDYGPCTAEAAPYLRGISGFYHRMRAGDTAVFVHFHATVGAAPGTRRAPINTWKFCAICTCRPTAESTVRRYRLAVSTASGTTDSRRWGYPTRGAASVAR